MRFARPGACASTRRRASASRAPASVEPKWNTSTSPCGEPSVHFGVRRSTAKPTSSPSRAPWDGPPPGGPSCVTNEPPPHRISSRPTLASSSRVRAQVRGRSGPALMSALADALAELDRANTRAVVHYRSTALAFWLLVIASLLIVLSMAWQPYIEPWAMTRLAAMR